MIARHWRGWTEIHNANAYEFLLKTKVLPALKQLAGYRGGYILRNEGADEVEFVVVNFSNSLDAFASLPGTTMPLLCLSPRPDCFCHESSPLPGTMKCARAPSSIARSDTNTKSLTGVRARR